VLGAGHCAAGKDCCRDEQEAEHGRADVVHSHPPSHESPAPKPAARSGFSAARALATLTPIYQLEKLRLLGNYTSKFRRPAVSLRRAKRWSYRSTRSYRAVMEIKRILSFVDEVRSEAGRRAEPPLRKSAVVASVQNPLAGRYVEDLSSLVAASEAIGREISGIAVRLLAPDKPVSYGKAAVIGLAGEQEHGNAMLTTVFGNVMREAAGGGKA